MTETSTFTLNDFPNEIIEKFIPDHKPNTISSLKLVSKRFNDIFSYDYFYKYYLHFPEKHYLCEAKSDKNSAKDVFKDIESGAVGKWKGYLMTEHIHLENLSKGEFTHCEIVQLPTRSRHSSIIGGCWDELIDENGEHWLVTLIEDDSIVLLNITDKPKMFITDHKKYGVEPEGVRLVAGQVILITCSPRSIFVLDIVNDGDAVLLQLNFKYNLHCDINWTCVSGRCESDGSLRNMFVSIHSSDQDDDYFLHFIDLKTGNVLEEIGFREYKCLDRYYDQPLRCELEFEFLKNVEFPNVIMTIQEEDQELLTRMILVFNVDKMQATSVIDMSVACEVQCNISCNIAYILSWTHENNVSFINVHGVSLERSCANMENPTTPDRLCPPLKGDFHCKLSNCLKFAFKDSKISNKVHIMSINDFRVRFVEVFLDIDEEFYIHSVIGPVLNIETFPGTYNPVISSFKISKEGGGQCIKVIDWGKVFAEKKIQFNYPSLMSGLMDFSKFVFIEAHRSLVKECLAIFHF